ncbi:alpha/beta fold hydrolase [Ramlibacter sp. PS4R-6]|uniref:alpha/beta fold hydrolase n=1 Tax=Ramlibacter sp. PS4R-6 TaxID=3133438 RepID=UPI0030B1FF49
MASQTPIVLVPGLLCAAELFAPQVPALWPHGPVHIASTLQGDTIAEIASAILASAPPRFALAGLSMGGYISMEIMRQAPARVTKLALLDTSARPDTPEQSEFRRTLIARTKAGEFEAVFEQTLGAFLRPAVWNDPQLQQVWRRMALTTGADAYCRHLEAIIARIDSRPSLARVAVPTLVVVGELDPLTPPERAREIAGLIAGARLVEVPQCGHGSTLDQPGVVTRELVQWLEQ